MSLGVTKSLPTREMKNNATCHGYRQTVAGIERRRSSDGEALMTVVSWEELGLENVKTTPLNGLFSRS